MGHKIFVSYKYADSNVYNITGSRYGSTVRDYVDEIEEILAEDESNHIYKGESDGEDLSQLSEDTIWKTLRDRIYDSSLTIVMISPNMKEFGKSQKQQWIPREISYCLKETSRVNKNGDPVTSKTNAMLAVVIPDKNNSYSYYTYNNTCCSSGCRILRTEKLYRWKYEWVIKMRMKSDDFCYDLNPDNKNMWLKNSDGEEKKSPTIFRVMFTRMIFPLYGMILGAILMIVILTVFKLI